MFGQDPRHGDWVKTTATVPITITDHLAGTGIAPGARGVVIDRNGRNATVQFGSGRTRHTAVIPVRHLTITKRAGGVAPFESRTALYTKIRFGVAIAIFAPYLWATAQYLWAYKTLDGLIPFLIEGTLTASFDLFIGALNNPGKAILFLALSWLTARIAFGRHRR